MEHPSVLPATADAESLAMAEVLALQALPEGGGALTAQAQFTGVGSYISIWNDCAGHWSITCIP